MNRSTTTKYIKHILLFLHTFLKASSLKRISIFLTNVFLMLFNPRYDEIGDAALFALAEHCPQLASIKIGYSNAVTDESFRALGQHSIKVYHSHIYKPLPHLSLFCYDLSLIYYIPFVSP